MPPQTESLPPFGHHGPLEIRNPHAAEDGFIKGLYAFPEEGEGTIEEKMPQHVFYELLISSL